jgi:uncharacterized protein YjbJ (UPF0337 family)
MNKDQAKGRLAEVKGKIKEAAGKIVGNQNLEQRGKLQSAEGKIEANVGDLKAKADKKPH